MTSSPWRGLLGAAALLLLILVGWAYRPFQTSGQVPDLVFTSLKGERIALRQLLGRPVLVTFWSTECRPCLEEIPDLVRLHADYAGRGLEVIAVAVADDMPSRVVELAEAKHIPYILSLDVDGSHARAFSRVMAVPYSVLISPKGEIAQEKLGAVDFPSLRRRIEAMFSEV